MNISLPEELKKYVEAQTKAGYSTPSEYVRELIREDQKRQFQEQLEHQLLKGLNSGDPILANKEFWADLKSEAVGLIQARKMTKAKRK